MTAPAPWAAPAPLPTLTAEDLARPGVVFECAGYRYRTSGRTLGNGGMGNTFLLARRPASSEAAEVERVVGKVFHSEYLYQLRTDEITRRDHEEALTCIDQICLLDHPHLLETLVSEPISHNHLSVTPHRCETLRQAIATRQLSTAQRIDLLAQALEALAVLHRSGFIHRDVTLRNILVDEEGVNAYLFDFDLALSANVIAGASFKSRYQGRIFGSPGFSVPPEILDANLMELPITNRIDIYAIGAAIFGLFSDELPYGKTEDMWGLLLRISDGVVIDGNSRIVYPPGVPPALRPLIERCMERDPRTRVGTVDEIIVELKKARAKLVTGATLPPPRTFETLIFTDAEERVASVHQLTSDQNLTRAVIERVDEALGRYNYQVVRSMGRVKDHPIFMAQPDPALVAQGQFPDSNTYPKIVTLLDLSRSANRKEVVDLWMGGYLPALRAARQGLLTPLHRVVFDEKSAFLLLFSEYVDHAKFGTELDRHTLTPKEALSLGYLVARQVRRLHERGVAHNNIAASSLLLKGLPKAREVHPAMVGIVAPSLNKDDQVRDVLRLAALILDWLDEGQIALVESNARARLLEMHTRLCELASANTSLPRTIDGLIGHLADGLSAIDFNFGVLRDNMGDPDAYALLLVSHSLYGRLWESDD